MKSPYPTNEVRHWLAPCMVVVCVLSLALFWSPVTAQEPRAWTVYRSETPNGPSGLQVRSLWQDTDGSLWVGSSKGLSHFDGLNWRHLTKGDGLPDTTIRAVIRDRAGRLWIGTDHGAARLDGDRWTIYNVRDGLASEEVNALLADQRGHLWFGTRDGLSRFDGLAWITYTFDHVRQWSFGGHDPQPGRGSGRQHLGRYHWRGQPFRRTPVEKLRRG